MQKPENHVTRAMQHRLLGAQGTVTPAPRVPEELVKWLEARFPPKCYEPSLEKLEDHLLYAGMVGLVASMRGTLEEQKASHDALAALAEYDGGLADGVEGAIIDRLKEE